MIRVLEQSNDAGLPRAVQENGFALATVKHRHDNRRPFLNKRDVREDAGVEYFVYRFFIVRGVFANLAKLVSLADFVIHGDDFLLNTKLFATKIAHVRMNANILCETRLCILYVVASCPYQPGTHGDEMA